MAGLTLVVSKAFLNWRSVLHPVQLQGGAILAGFAAAPLFSSVWARYQNDLIDVTLAIIGRCLWALLLSSHDVPQLTALCFLLELALCARYMHPLYTPATEKTTSIGQRIVRYVIKTSILPKVIKVIVKQGKSQAWAAALVLATSTTVHLAFRLLPHLSG